MPITSFVVHTRAGSVDAVSDALQAYDGVNCVGRQGDALAVVVESPDRAADRALCDRIEATVDVLAVDAIYHNFEDDHDASLS